ncbi:hypothetical protein LCGC14_1705100 [marine sediment metagenome]|uniref:Uncharacterized protein n=1 Tax=marine sediment metagenome TaxID=412755 RepID=A0A0F9HGJ1_9ZZZZ
MYTFVDLQNEVKRRATRDQGGTQFDIATDNIINTSIFRISREAPWRVMRRRTHFRTKQRYEIGSGNATFNNNSSSIATSILFGPVSAFFDEGIRIGRRVKLSGDARFFIIRKVTAQNVLILDRNYSGTSTSTGTYKILGQCEYNLPVQAGHRMFMWHEEWGSPYKMDYITDQDYFDRGFFNTEEGIPIAYRMWGEDMTIEQPKDASVMRIASSASADKNVAINVFGTVSGFPDFETITTDNADGTTAVSGSKSFQTVERVVKSASTTGRITVDANSANTIIAVLPVGDTTAGIFYRKIQLYPLPSSAFDMNVQYYKDPYRLVNDNDIHELGQDFDEAIILLSVSKVKGESEIKGAGSFFSFWQDEMNSLKRINADKIDWFPSLRKPREGRGHFSRVHPFLQHRQAGPFYGPRVG